MIANLRTASRALLANRLRSGLTLLGILIGVAAVVAMVSIGSGAQQRVNERIQSLGTNLLLVTPSKPVLNGVVQQQGTVSSLTYADAVAVVQQAPDVVMAAPEMTKRFQVVAGGQNTTTIVDGTTPEFPQVRSYRLASGRFIAEPDLTNLSTVAVLGANVAQELFPTADPVGTTVRIGNVNFLVVGVMATKGSSGPQSGDDSIWVPLTTGQQRLFGNGNLQDINFEVRNAGAMDLALAEIRQILEQQHRITGGADDFTIANQAALIESADSVSRTFTLLLAGIAAVSLLVGGIGVMNVMLVTVTERTREIGLRKALGATPARILAQFVTESALLALAGGFLGILAGVAAAAILARVGGWPTLVSPTSALLAFAVSAAVGIVFGLYPSQRAARMLPIEALRYE